MPVVTVPSRGIAALALATASLLTLHDLAHAELKVRMPTVDYREVELEHNGLVTFGSRTPFS